MKKLAIATAGIFLLAPALADASQPAQPPQTSPTTGSLQPAPAEAAPAQKPDEPVTGQPAASASKDAPTAPATCASSGSSDKAAHPSAKVGKDTGELPPPRKKSSSGACASQPDR